VYKLGSRPSVCGRYNGRYAVVVERKCYPSVSAVGFSNDLLSSALRQIFITVSITKSESASVRIGFRRKTDKCGRTAAACVLDNFSFRVYLRNSVLFSRRRLPTRRQCRRDPRTTVCIAQHSIVPGKYTCYLADVNRISKYRK